MRKQFNGVPDPTSTPARPTPSSRPLTAELLDDRADTWRRA